MLKKLMLNALCLVMNYATPKSYCPAHFLHFHKPVRKTNGFGSHLLVWTKMKINGTRNCSVTNILQNIFFCVPQQKESHTGLE